MKYSYIYSRILTKKEIQVTKKTACCLNSPPVATKNHRSMSLDAPCGQSYVVCKRIVFCELCSLRHIPISWLSATFNAQLIFLNCSSWQSLAACSKSPSYKGSNWINRDNIIKYPGQLGFIYHPLPPPLSPPLVASSPHRRREEAQRQEFGPRELQRRFHLDPRARLGVVGVLWEMWKMWTMANIGQLFFGQQKPWTYMVNICWIFMVWIWLICRVKIEYWSWYWSKPVKPRIFRSRS